MDLALTTAEEENAMGWKIDHDRPAVDGEVGVTDRLIARPWRQARLPE
jgi:hypothetical protein